MYAITDYKATFKNKTTGEIKKVLFGVDNYCTQKELNKSNYLFTFGKDCDLTEAAKISYSRFNLDGDRMELIEIKKQD